LDLSIFVLLQSNEPVHSQQVQLIGFFQLNLIESLLIGLLVSPPTLEVERSRAIARSDLVLLA